ncbi:hypothetical protein [Kitasatospora sp. NPDC015120]|uniref:hypothetical protein n=1 Tax=Kitasatospora sp. NPDC015120 TaxID=3364023 RepID=UPI0036F45AF4
MLIAAGLGLLGRVSADGGYLTDVLPATLPLGIGFGMAMPAPAGLAMPGATPEDSGPASGRFNTLQQVGAALGPAVLSTLAASRTDGLPAHGAPAGTAYAGGHQLAFRIAACFVLGAAVVAMTVLRTPAKPSAAPVVAARPAKDAAEV